jgi:hypothetical protein
MAYYRLEANGPNDDDMRIIAKTEGRARFSIVKVDDGAFEGEIIINWLDGEVDRLSASARLRRIKADLFELSGAFGGVHVTALYDAKAKTFAREMTNKKLIGREFVTLECFLHGFVDIAQEAGVFGRKTQH